MRSLKEKLSYAFGQFGLQAIDIALRLYLLAFYVDELGLSPFLAGLAAGLAVAWDAVTDPWMGSFSDKQGRRRFWFLPGGVLSAIFVTLIFSGFSFESQALLFAVLLMNYMLLNTALTIFDIPYHAMGAEISTSTEERTSIFAWRLVFSNLGAFVPLALPVLLADWSASARYTGLGVGVGLAVLTSSLVAMSGTRERARPNPLIKIRLNPFASAKEIFKNRLVLSLMIAYVVANIGLAVNSAIAVFYYEHFLKLSVSETQYVIMTFMFVLILALPLWVKMAQIFDKRLPLFWGILLLGLSGALVYPLFPERQLFGPLVYAVFAGVLAGSILLLDAWLVDLLEYDEARFGESRTGAIYGFWRLSAKLTRAVSLFLVGSVLQAIGFVADQSQTAEVEQRLGWFFGPGVNLFFVLGAFLVLKIRFSAHDYQKTKRILAFRRKRIKDFTAAAESTDSSTKIH